MIEIRSLRIFEEMNRIIHRVEKLYDGIIINEVGEDSFQTPKEQIFNFFRCSYELKENLKIDFPQLANNIENEIENNNWIKIALDSANQRKHGNLKKPRSTSIIGEVNTRIHILDPNGKKNRTELTIEINNSKIDCLILLKNTKLARENIFKKLKLVL